MKKILLSGGEGEFAQQLLKVNTDHQIFSPSKEEMDITNSETIDILLNSYQPDIFLHAGAYTRPMKKHQDNPDISIATNIIGTSNVVLACIKHKIKLIYISTDYVYPGTEGNYSEDDALSPFLGNNDGITKYGWSKLGGECAAKIYDNSLILRMCMYSHPFPHDQAPIDVKKNLMFHHEAAEVVLLLLDEFGVINVGGKAQSVYDFASAYDPTIRKISRDDIEDVTIAPDTTMNISKLKEILK